MRSKRSERKLVPREMAQGAIFQISQPSYNL
jgi:hypothetical protein